MLVQVQRAYGGQEGKRVRVGDRFWVSVPGKAKAPVGVQVISHARYQQLKQQRLVAQIAAETAKAAAPLKKVEREPRRTGGPAPATPGAKVEPDSRPPAKDPRRAAGLRAPAPKTKSRPGGQTGKGEQPSSSRAAPQTGTSTLKQRGTRRGQTSGGSPSTTPSASSPGATSSTDATPPGGGTTQTQEDSAAFD